MEYFFFFFKNQSLPQKITPEIPQNLVLGILYSLSISETLYVYLLNVERDEFGLRRRKASPFANPVLAPLSDDMKNSSCIRRSLPPWNAFYVKGRFPVK